MSQLKLGQTAPALQVSEWLQGQASQFEALPGRVILVEVFQVNCPGCFLYALPQAIDLHQRYADKGLAVIGIATAFEDFDKNTQQNVQLLLETGQLVGESLRVLTEQGQAENGRWRQRIPFPVAMDKLVKNRQPVDEEAAEEYIRQHLPHLAAESAAQRQRVRQRVMGYLRQLRYRAATFERYELQGTPSHILVDKQGLLRACRFGFFPELERQILQLLAEPART